MEKQSSNPPQIHAAEGEEELKTSRRPIVERVQDMERNQSERYARKCAQEKEDCKISYSGCHPRRMYLSEPEVHYMDHTGEAWSESGNEARPETR